MGKYGVRAPRWPISLIHPLGPLFRHLPLSLRRHLLYARFYARWGNFRNPTRYSEKSQWRILSDRRTLLAFAQDKLAAKEYVRSVAAELKIPLHIPATYWVGSSIRELQALANRLPARWVFKPNHSAGRVLLIDTTYEELDWNAITTIGKEWLQHDEEEVALGQWAYGEARHLLVAEEWIGEEQHPPVDYKVICFGGVPAYYYYSDRRSEDARIAVFEPGGVRFEFGSEYSGRREVLADGEHALELLNPSLAHQMMSIASAAATPFDSLRVDFYVDKGQLWFGELTLYNAAGLLEVGTRNRVNDVSDQRFGALWQLPDLAAHDPRETEWRALLAGVPKGTLQG
jgi:hypothetical protein